METEKTVIGLEAAKAVVIVSLGAKSAETIALVQRLISEASGNYPQLAELNFLPIPLPIPQLENWTYWLAAQLVNKWRDISIESITVEAIVSELGLLDRDSNCPLISALDKTATGTSISAELSTRLQSLGEQQALRQLSNSNLHQWLEQEVVALSDWFAPPPQTDTVSIFASEDGVGCLAQLKTNASAVRSKSRLQLQEFFVPLRHAGPRAVLKLLKNLGETLTNICANYEAKRQNYLRREGSAWRAYYSLSAQLENRSLIPRRRKLEKEALIQAIRKASNFKLEAEIVAVASQVVGSLRQQTHVYAVTLAQADALLASLHNYFIKRYPTEPIFASILQQYLVERVDIAKLRRKIEVLVGCSLNQWGSLNSAQQVVLREQILLHVRPLCLEIYTECYRSLINLNPDLQIHSANTGGSLSISLTNLPQKLDETVNWQSSSPSNSDREQLETDAENDLTSDRPASEQVFLPFLDVE